jgi:hypothetical protein
VITLMTDDQVRDVRALTRAAGIHPETTRVNGGTHPVLARLAPGARVLVPGGLGEAATAEPSGRGNRSGGGKPRRRTGAPSSRGGAPKAPQARESRGGGQRSGGKARPARRTTGGRGHSAASFSAGR